MKQGLSKREKILLFSAGIVVLLYLAIQFAILPLMARHSEAIQERDRLAAERRIVEADIANKQAIRNANTAAGDRYLVLKDEYPLLIPNEEIATVLTNLCLTNGLRPSMLNIIPPATPVPGQLEQDAPPPIFTIVTATMNVTGGYPSLLSLLDDIDALQYIRLINLGYSLSRQPESSEDGDISLTFELTFINP